MTKKLTGKFFTFKFAGRKYDITGVVLDYNDDWTLIKHNSRFSGWISIQKLMHSCGDFFQFAIQHGVTAIGFYDQKPGI
jgi:hypothetical protein